jgi:hypothetical protein
MVRVCTARVRRRRRRRSPHARAMLLLFETPAGYSLFKVKDEKKLADAEVRAVDARARGDEGDARRARRARDAVDDRWGGGATRDATRDATTGRRDATRDARVECARDVGKGASARERDDGRGRGRGEGIGELGIGADGAGTRGRGDARRDGETDETCDRRARRACKMRSARWRGRKRWCR